MKRLITFLALCCLVVTGAWAGVTSVKTSPGEGGKYHVYTLASQGTSGKYWAAPNGTLDSDATSSTYWYFEDAGKDSDGTTQLYYVADYATGNYLSYTEVGDNKTVTLGTSKSPWKIKAGTTGAWTGHIAIYTTSGGKDYGLNCNGNQYMYSAGDNANANSYWDATETEMPAPAYPVTNITTTFSNTDNTLAGVTVTVSATDADGNAVNGLTASVSGNTGLKTSQTNKDVIELSTNTNTWNAEPLNFTINNMAAGSSFNTITLPLYAFNSGDGWQPSTMGVRNLNVSVVVKEGNTTLYEGSITDFNIGEKCGENVLNDLLVFSSSTPITKTTDGPLSVEFTFSKGTTNTGCFVAFKSLNLTTPTPQTYTIGADGKPDCVTVKIEGNVVDGEWPQGFDYVASKQLSNADIEVTTDDGYVATYTVDNTHHQVNFSFDRIFEPIEYNASIADDTKKYFVKNPAGYYIDYIDPNLPGTQARKDAAKFVFEKSAEAGKYYIYCVDAQKYLKYTGTGNGGNETSQAGSKVQLVDAKGDNCLWVFDNQVCIIPAAGGGAGLNFTGGADKTENKEACVLNLYSTGDDKSKWQIIDSKLGSLACATLVFSKPGEEFIHKLIPEEGVTIESVDFDTDLNGALTLKERPNYKYVSGTAPMQEKDYIYNVNLSDGTTAKVTLRVESFLQSPTPFMGWLSWNWFGQGINETNMKAIGQGLKDKGLIDAGYTTLVLDDTWAANTGSKDNLIWHATKFPNPTQFISDIKALGLKLGIYSDAGSSTCTGQQPGSYGYETQHMALFKEWGIDFLKYDRCNAQGGLEQAYSAMGRAIAAVNAERKQAGSTTPFVFNACEWGRGKPWTWGAEAGASSWRSTEDGREEWCGTHGRPGVLYCSDETREYWMYTGVNRYNDLDMMCIGLHGYGGPSNNTSTHGSDGGKLTNPLTTEQARSQMSIWCMFASPLSITCDVRETPSPDGNKSVTLPEKLITDDDLAILKNKDIISINQDALGQQAEYMKSLSHDDEKGTANAGGYSVYLKDLKGGKMALAIVNRSATATLEAKTIAFDQIYLSSTANYYVKDVWAGTVKQQTGNLVTDAFAASETKVYIISEEPFEEEVKPEFSIATESTVTSSELAGLTITFTGANAADVKLSETQHVAYLTKKTAPAQAKALNGKLKAAGETDAIEGEISKVEGETGVFSIAFPEESIFEGDYEVSIPEGTFYVGTEEHPVPLLKADYEVLPTFITSLDQLDNGTAYTITSFDRGQWTAVNDKNYIYQTAGTAAGKTWNTEKDGYTPISANSTEANQQWAILKSDKGNYYLYNVGQQKFFVSKDNYSTAKAKAELATEPNTSDFQILDKASDLKETALNNYNSSNQAVRFALSMSGNFFGVTDWDGEDWKVFQNNNDYNTNKDAGMYFKIVPVASFDATAAMAKIEEFEGETVVPETGYYYIKESGKYLYNDQSVGTVTQKSDSYDGNFNNRYIWHITNDGNGNLTLLNGEGKGYKANESAEEITSLGETDFLSLQLVTSPVELTSDYKWVDVVVRYADGMMTYTHGENATQYVANGGFFALYKTNRSDGDISYTPVDGFKAASISDETRYEEESEIRVSYYTQETEDKVHDMQVRIMDWVDHLNCVGYPTYETIFEDQYMEDYVQVSSSVIGGLDVPFSPGDYFDVEEAFNRMCAISDVIMPEIGDAYTLAVRSKNGSKHYLVEGGGLTTDKSQASVFVLGTSGNAGHDYLLATNDNEQSHYLQYKGATSKTYSANTCDIKFDAMVGTGSNANINASMIQRVGTFAIQTAARPDDAALVGTLTVKEDGSTWDKSKEPFMNDSFTSAIEMEVVDYPYTHPTLASGTGDGHEGVFASVWLPFPMNIPDGIEVYKGTQERDVKGNPYLGLTQVNPDENSCYAKGGYILYSSDKSLAGQQLVLPANSVPNDQRDYDEDAAFAGSTENPELYKHTDEWGDEIPGDTELWTAFKNAHTDSTPYVLANKSAGIGFYKYTGTTYPKGKAIWMKPATDNDSEVVKLGFGDIITAIEALHGNTKNAEIFDLQGRRLDKVQKGQVNVINGQKIMFK